MTRLIPEEEDNEMKACEMKTCLGSILVLAVCLSLSIPTHAQETSANEVKSIEELFNANPSDRTALWIQLINRISQNKKVTIAEIGVWKGEFAYQILKNCPSVEKYYLVDPWRHLDDWKKPLNVSDERFNRVFETAMKKLEFAKDRITVLRGTTLEVVDQIDDNELDLVYIDGDHTAKGIVIDLIRLFPKVKKGGVVGGDDYVDNVYRHDPNHFEPTMVKPVVNGFVAAHTVRHFFSTSSQFAFIK